MIAAAGAGMAAVDHEFLRAQPRRVRFLVDDLGLGYELAPVGRGMNIDLDHSGIGRDAEALQAGIAAGRRVALDPDRLAELPGGVLPRGPQSGVGLPSLRPARGNQTY